MWPCLRSTSQRAAASEALILVVLEVGHSSKSCHALHNLVDVEILGARVSTHALTNRHVVIYHQDTFGGFDDMVVTGQGEPLGFHTLGRLAKMVRRPAHGLHRLQSDMAIGSHNLLRHGSLVKIGEVPDLVEGVGRGHSFLQVSTHVVEGHSPSDFVILQVLKQILARAVANVGREPEGDVGQGVRVAAHLH